MKDRAADICPEDEKRKQDGPRSKATERNGHTCRTFTTSSAMAMIHTTATKKPIAHRASCAGRECPVSANTETIIAAVKPATPVASTSGPSCFTPSATTTTKHVFLQ